MSGVEEVRGLQKEEENEVESKLTIGFVGRPQGFIEEPRRVTPLVVNQFNREPTTVQIFHKQTPWSAKNTCIPVKQKKRCKLFRWCRRKKSYKTERVNEVVRLGRKRREIIREVELRQRSESLPPVVIKEKRHVLKRSASVKPVAATRYATVKKYKHKAPLAERFVNCIYRMCCQFYCYLTCVIIVIVVVVFVL